MEQGKRLEECLCVRRSIRQFTDQPVERTIIQTLLEMAILAPSASNRQPWRFIILDDPVLVQKIRAFSPGIGGNPPCLIVFCLDSQRLPVMRNGTIDRTCGIIDLAMAAENMMLAATSHGLGTCVIKSYHPQIVKKILELPVENGRYLGEVTEVVADGITYQGCTSGNGKFIPGKPYGLGYDLLKRS